MDARSQTFGSLELAPPPVMLPGTSDDGRRLHQDHKAIKRAIDKGAQDSAAALSSLHEKASRINLSISDLHADLKRLERVASLEGGHPHTGVVDMEIKLGSLVRSLESKLMDGISAQVAAAIDARSKDILRQIDDRLATHADKLAGFSAAASEILAAVRSAELGSGHRPGVPLLQMPPPATSNPGQRLLAPPQCSVFDVSAPMPASAPAAERRCLSFGFGIEESRTSCGASFSIADAMARAAGAQYQPAAACDQPPASGKRARRSRR
ncbi:hypothetical protein IWQ57_003736 [Coemansia nantahalensis]|uniref:Uncharacterized protein n=1 Tax=Coemansia nantahalensis TaxID=2789366 RepID=A0ACC1JVI2_9FUNG|nr:hypothetical protein IWQ57_003736 [Coemansia nantahalensis]